MLKKHGGKILITIFIVTVLIIAIKGLVPKSKAGPATDVEVTYKAGEGTGKEVTTTQPILGEKSRKIVLTSNAIHFDGGVTEVEGHTYKKVLTGWKVTEIVQNGEKVTKNLDTTYAQNGYYIVPNGVTSIEVTAIYGRAIYVKSTEVQSEEVKSYGTSLEDAVPTLKRAYELVEEDAESTVYDTVFVLCGDLYEENSVEDSYSLGSQISSNKPVTITSESDNKYNLYLSTKDEKIEIYSSLRFDNVCVKGLSVAPDLEFFSTGIFEVTENTETDNFNLLYGNLSKVILNGGTWNPMVAENSTIIEELSKDNLLQIGGNANVSTLRVGFKEDDGIVKNPPIVKITGGEIKELIGTENANLVFSNFDADIEKIEKWENILLENSYVVFSGQLKEITNISVPDGSGLKFAENQEIAGNFNGGGELYMDSNCCFTINGDITGTTKLILTPSIVDGKNIIVGGINHPYLKVKGGSIAKTQSASSDEIVSGESKYTILSQKGDYSYYYIDADVEISNFVEIKSTSVSDKIYNGSLGTKIGSDAEDINILEIGSYTQDLELNYEFYKNSTTPNKYTNIKRQFVLKSDKRTVYAIPDGTEILMLYNGKKYTYVASENINAIDLALFKDEDGNAFKQISNLQVADGVNKETNSITGDTLYNYSESFRFVVSFANIIGNNCSIDAGTYYSIINILDDDNWIDSEQLENTNKVNISQVVFTPSDINTELEKYEGNGVVTIKSEGTVKTYGGTGKQLYGNIKLHNAKGEQVDIPVGSRITLNEQNCNIINGTTQCKFLDNCTDNGTSYNFNFQMDMSNVLVQNQLQAGNYKIEFAYAFAQDDLLNGNIAGWLEVPLTIVNYSNSYGLDVNIENNQNIPNDKIQLITKGTEENRTIKANYLGQLEEPVIKVSALEKTSDFDYSDTENSQKITIKDNGNGSYKITFSDSLDAGIYRVAFELIDKYGNKKSENFVNFVVVETPSI